MVATDRIRVPGYHFPFPANGHAVRAGNGFRCVPAGWSSVVSTAIRGGLQGAAGGDLRGAFRSARGRNFLTGTGDRITDYPVSQ